MSQPTIKSQAIHIEIKLLRENLALKTEHEDYTDIPKSTEFICTFCLTEYEDKQSFYDHIRTHFKKIVCHICQKICIGDQNYEYHIKNAHKSITPHNHFVDTLLNKNPKLKCIYCKEQYQTVSNLQQHISDKHSESNSCDFCAKQCKDQNALRLHKRNHMNNKKFECDICKKVFTKKGNIIYHMNIHTGNRPFMCDICGKSFAHKSGLSSHTRIHTGERPYQCPYCERRFNHCSDLRRHRRTHGYEERFFVCKLCGSKFYENKFLRIHMKCHQNIKNESTKSKTITNGTFKA